MPKQARAGLAPERPPDPPLGLGQPAGASCAGSEQLGQALGEGAPAAGGVAAVEPARAQLDPDRRPEQGQVGRAPPVAAVDGPARAPAVRAATAGPRAVRQDVEETRVVARDPLDAATWHGTELVHAPPYRARPATLQTPVPASRTTQSAGEPLPRGEVHSMTSSPAAATIPPSWFEPSAGIRASRTRCIGSSTSASARMTAACATARPPATSRSSS